MEKLLFFALLYCISVPVSSSFWSKSIPIQECKNPGSICEDCTHVVACVEEGGEFVKEPIVTCTAPNTCLAAVCTTNRNPRCEPVYNSAFVCSDSGMFPDPFDCNKYHFCVLNTNGTAYNHFLATCDAGYAFNSETFFCDKEVATVPACDPYSTFYPIPICLTPGQTGALDNNRLYYICEQYNVNATYLYPFQYTCKHGEIYNENFECIPDTGEITTDVMTTGVSTTTSRLISTSRITTSRITTLH